MTNLYESTSTQTEKTVKIILIGIPHILKGIPFFPSHLSEVPVFSGPTLGTLCSLLGLSCPQDVLVFLYTCHTQRKAQPVCKDMLEARRALWVGRKSKEESSLAFHWRHLPCPFLNHQFPTRTLASPSHSYSIQLWFVWIFALLSSICFLLNALF